MIETLESRLFCSASPLNPAIDRPATGPGVTVTMNDEKAPPQKDPPPHPVVIAIIAILIG